MRKFDYYPFEEGQKLLKRIEKAYPRFYIESKEDLKYFNERTYNSSNKFWGEIGKDIVRFIPGGLTYSGSRIFQFLKTEKKDQSARNFEIGRINSLKKLVLIYETHIYDPENQKIVSLHGQTDSQESNIIPNSPELIPGAEIIDNEFCEKIRTGFSFSKSQFYTAKQNDYCQWYGVIHNFDIRRSQTDAIKDILNQGFDNKYTPNKVSCIIHGLGGCGKSTILRRIAVELSDINTFLVVWVKEGQFKTFYKKGLPIIKKSQQINFLIFMEDWYRLTNLHSRKAREFLEQISTMNHVRVCIGDRQIEEKVYLRYLQGDHKFLLDNRNNEQIINAIIKKHKQWKDTAKKVFKNKKMYNSTLFLLLFILARIYEDNKTSSSLDFSDPENAFQDIIYNDLKIISSQYKGLTKILFYWASIYAIHKIHISYDFFLQLADYFNTNKHISSNFSHLNKGKGLIYDRLRIYFHSEKLESEPEVSSEQDFLHFNHDILADLGIVHIQHRLNLEYNDIVKREICECLTRIRDNDYSVSLVLSLMFQYEKQIFENTNNQLYYVNKLLEQNNHEFLYLNALIIDSLPVDDLHRLMSKLKKREVYPDFLWANYINKFPVQALGVLKQGNVLTLPPRITTSAMNILNDPKDSKNTCHIILNYPELTELPHQIVTKALKMSRDQKDRQEACHFILNHPDIIELSAEVVSTALKVSNNKDDKKTACNTILNHPRYMKFPAQVISALKVSKDKKQVRAVCKSICNSLDFADPLYPYEITVTALKLSWNQKEKNSICHTILSYPDLVKLRHELVLTTLKVTTNNNDRQLGCNSILSQSDLSVIPHEIVSVALKLSNKELKEKTCHTILNDVRLLKLPHQIVSTALKMSQDNTDIEKSCSAILSYSDLLSLPQEMIAVALKKSKNRNAKVKTCHILLNPTNREKLSSQLFSLTQNIYDSIQIQKR